MLPTGEAGVRVAFDTAWPDVALQLLRGVTHALGNRVMTIATLAQLVRDEGANARAGDALDGEAARLDALLRQLRMLCAHDAGREEPLDLEELAREVAELLHRHVEVQGVAWRVLRTALVLPAWGDRSLVMRMLAVMLVAGARHAQRLGREEGIVEIAGDGAHRTLVVRVGTADAAAFDAAGDEAPPEDPAAPVLRCRDGAHGARYTLRLVTLAEARRLGR